MSRLVDVCIVPDQTTQYRAREMGRKLAEGFQAQHTLYDTRLTPHISLYQLSCPASRYPELKAFVRRIADRRSFKAGTKGVEVRSSGYVWWRIKKSTKLQDLHRDVLKTLNPLREELLLPGIKPDFSGYETGRPFNPEEREAVRMYGTPHALGLFKPHITVGKLERPQNVFASLQELDGEFVVDSVCIGNIVEHGAVAKIEERYGLIDATL